MEDVREIVARTVVAKGHKVINLNHSIKLDVIPYSILGCWVINHNYKTYLEDEKAYIDGEFEVNIWYSVEQNTKTLIAKDIVKYKKEIKLKQMFKEYIKGSTEIIIEESVYPHVNDAKIVDDSIQSEINFDLTALLIGDAKMIVSILSDSKISDIDIEDIDMEINENFLKEE